MKNWDIYLRESYDLVRRAECELTINLPQDLEAYTVQLFAHYMDKPLVNTVPIGVKLLSSQTMPTPVKKEMLKSIGDECLLIDAMEWGKRRWPSTDYYAELGQTAYFSRAYAQRPPEDLYDDLAAQFQMVSKILRKCRAS